MNTKSGQNTTTNQDQSVPSQEQQSKESLVSKDKKEVKSSLEPLALKLGDPRHIREAVANNLINIAESESGCEITDESKRYLQQFIDMTSKGFVTSMSMNCAGKLCPYINACPLHAIGSKLPIGKPCPVENSIVVTWITKHLKVLGIDDIEDPVHSFDMDMLYELAGQELIRRRCSVHLSDDPRLVSNQQIAATQQGEPIFADVINPVLDVMERAGRNIGRIREALVATREAQVKAGQIATDPSTRAAELREKAMAIADARRKQQEVLKDADYRIKNE